MEDKKIVPRPSPFFGEGGVGGGGLVAVLVARGFGGLPFRFHNHMQDPSLRLTMLGYYNGSS